MAWKRINKDYKLEKGDVVRSHFKVDYPNLTPDFVEGRLEKGTAWIVEHLKEFSEKVNNRLTGEARVEFTDAYYEKKDDFYDLVFEYEVKHTSVLLVATVVSILTSWEFWVGLGIFIFLLKFSGTFEHWFSELSTGGKIATLSIPLIVGALAYGLSKRGRKK